MAEKENKSTCRPVKIIGVTLGKITKAPINTVLQSQNALMAVTIGAGGETYLLLSKEDDGRFLLPDKLVEYTDLGRLSNISEEVCEQILSPMLGTKVQTQYISSLVRTYSGGEELPYTNKAGLTAFIRSRMTQAGREPRSPKDIYIVRLDNVK